MFKAMMSVLVVLMACVLVGCMKKPPIDLNELRANPAGGSQSSYSGNEDPFSAIDGDPLGGGFNVADSDAEIGTTGWAGTDQSLGGGLGGNFLSNASRSQYIIYFDYDRAEVKASERAKLDALAQEILADNAKGVIIEGHCDERGSDEYNRALSERRALAVKDYLATLGVAESGMQTISYGEDKPAVPNAQGESEHAKNRRVEFLVGTKK